MPTGRRRDDHVIGEGFADWLRQVGGHRQVDELVLRRPGAGHSNETIVAAAVTEHGSEAWVLRLPPHAPLVPDHDLGREVAVLHALADAGLPVPRPLAHEADERFLGVEFAVLPLVEGHVVGEAPPLDPWVTDAPAEMQARVEHGFLDLLARLHRLDLEATGLAGVLRGGSPADDVAWWSEYLGWAFADAPIPTLTAVVEHLRANAPPPGRAALRWGDARLGNVIFDDERRVRAAIDWELATVGAPESDLAWYLALDDLLRSFVPARVPGFLDRETLVAAYEQRAGRRVEHLPWHELFALLRSTAVNARIARLTGSPGGGEDSPVVGYVRRRLLASRG